MKRFDTIPAAPNRTILVGNDAAVSIPLNTAFFEASSLVVTLVQVGGALVVKTLTTDYTVSGGAGTTGTVTLTSFVPATGEFVVVEQREPDVQGTDYINGEGFNSETTEERLDRLTLEVRYLLDVVDRAPRVTILDDPSDPLKPVLPLPVANELLAGNAAGTGWEGQAATALGGLIGPAGPTGPAGAAGPGGASVWTYGTLNTTTGGSSLDLVTDFPAGVNEIEVDILNLSVSGTDAILLRVGPTGGLVTTDSYVGGVANLFSSLSQADFQAFFLNDASEAVEIYSGKVRLALVDAGTDLWACESILKRTESVNVFVQYGYIALTGAIEKLSVLASGANTFSQNDGVQVRYR